MNIYGKITGIKYKPSLASELVIINFKDFDINMTPGACILSDGKNTFAISKWVSPKPSRTYPYSRVYNTLNVSKKITVIPVIKDEGAEGDRDFLQWDSISLMSLLDVYVIPAYYYKASKHKTKKKITNQQFENNYVHKKIKEITQYHSSALHWNLNELNENFHFVLKKVIASYSSIEKSTGIKLHGIKGMENFQSKIGEDVSLFKEFARSKAMKAQHREFLTVQPKEKLITLSKAKITIENYLGGQYFLTVDEIKLTKEKLSLIEAKHTNNKLFPSKGSVMDGVVKMILFGNLDATRVDGHEIKSEAILELTSNKLRGQISSKSKTDEIKKFLSENKFSAARNTFIKKLFAEANANNFKVTIKHETEKRIDD